jgi:hypothetical protein
LTWSPSGIGKNKKFNPANRVRAIPAANTIDDEVPTNNFCYRIICKYPRESGVVVTITAVNDAVAEGTHSGTIIHAAASTDPGYSGIAIAAVNTTIIDDVSSFNEWTGGGVPITPELLTKYAVGGATNQTGSGEALSSTLSGPNFTLTAVVRTNDPLLMVIGQSSTDLITWTDLINNPSGTPSASQAGVPFGCNRRDFTIPIDVDVKKFLRLKITAPSP